MGRTLSEWLDWQETLRPGSDIKLGLERCRIVAQKLGILSPPFPIISVAGTNGKGSTVAAIESILLTANYVTGSWTSPHLLRFGERIRVAGKSLDDDRMPMLFERVDAARGTIDLTYFEFGTLMAMLHFHDRRVEIAILEVGLGGRLDAVNIFTPNVAVITRIALDHCQWLGSDREQIGVEKAGIMRSQRPAICGDPDPPQSLLHIAARIGSVLSRIGIEYHYRQQESHWVWSDNQRTLNLPAPGLNDAHRHLHCATAIAAVFALPKPWHPNAEAITSGVAAACIRGRFQRLATAPEIIVDIAHNAEAANALATSLVEQDKGFGIRRTLAIVAVLADKDAAAMFAPFATLVWRWHCVSLPPPRGRSAENLLQECPRTASAFAFSDIRTAYQTAQEVVEPTDRILIFGSVLAVAGILRLKGTSKNLNGMGVWGKGHDQM